MENSKEDQGETISPVRPVELWFELEVSSITLGIQPLMSIIFSNNPLVVWSIKCEKMVKKIMMMTFLNDFSTA